MSQPLRDVFGEYIDPEDPRFWDPDEFFPRHWKIRNKGKSGIVPFELWDHQLLMSAAVRRAYAEKKYIATVKPRKLGSSTFWSGIITQHVCWRPAVYCGIVAQRAEVATQITQGVMRMYKYCPDAVRPAADLKKKTTLRIPGSDSQLDIASIGQDDPLRGATGIHALLATEICKWKDSDEKWTSMLSNVPRGEGFVVAESTPLYHGDPLHKLHEDASDNPDSPWFPLFIPWTFVTEYSIDPPVGWHPSPDVLDYANEHGLNEAQAYWMTVKGLTDCMNRLDLFRAEYPINVVDCWLPGGESVFDTDKLLARRKEIDGNTNLANENPGWRVWHEPEPGHRYVVTVDPAGSHGTRDFWGIQVLDLTTCEQVAEYLGHGHAIELGKDALERAQRYNRATIYVESNGLGEGVLTVLEASGYPNLYWRRGEKPGWHSNKSTKSRAIANLQSLIADGSLKLNSKRAIDQLINYRGQWDGYGDRDVAGGHFDLVASLSIAAWAWHAEAGGTMWRTSGTEKDGRQRYMDYNRAVDEILRGSGTGHETPWGPHL